nr:uncharacterized protein LOC120962576 [Aegilops tauschii subsp. strangulata]
MAAAEEAMAPAQIDVRMDVALLHCQACLLPLKPPCSGTSAGTYHGVAEHKRVCPWIPCSCPQPDCAFLGPPAALLQCKPLVELEAHDDYGNWRQIPAFTGTCVKKCLSPSTSSRWPPSSSPRRRIMRC